MARLDLAPLTQRVGGAAWGRFRAEARTGQHGHDLAAPPWWTRWGRRARQRYRLTELARVNGLSYEPVATPRRPAAHIFDVPPTRVHTDRFGTPHFVVGNYEEIWDDGPGEPDGSRHGYAVFRLRESYPRTLVARTQTRRIKQLKDVEPVPGPAGRLVWSTKPEYPMLQRLLACGVVELMPTVQVQEIEIVGDELFVLRRAHFRLARPQLWEGLESMTEALAPFLAQEATPSEHNQVDVAPAQ